MEMDKVAFQIAQQQFCDWIRDPEKELPQVLSTDRMQVYRDLLFNNVCSFINLVYPIAQTLLGAEQWQSLLQEFFQKSKCESPFYNDISLQFREYLADQQHPVLDEYPWLAELLQYEWLELYLDTVEIEKVIFAQDQDWQLNTKIWVLVYQYPVYAWTTSMTLVEVKPMPSVIMVWRDEQDNVCIENLSPLCAMLIEQLNLRAHSETELRQLIQSVVPDFTQRNVHTQLQELRAFLTRLKLLHVPINDQEQ